MSRWIGVPSVRHQDSRFCGPLVLGWRMSVFPQVLVRVRVWAGCTCCGERVGEEDWIFLNFLNSQISVHEILQCSGSWVGGFLSEIGVLVELDKTLDTISSPSPPHPTLPTLLSFYG